MHGNLLKWKQIQLLFDVKGSFKEKANLGRKIGLSKDDINKVKEIHGIRIKYFHPFRIPESDENIKSDVVKVVRLIRELLKDFYVLE